MIADAQMRGASVREKLRNAEGGSWSPDEAAIYPGISKAAVLKRYKKGRLVAWHEEKQGDIRIPVWQFVDHHVLRGLEEVLSVLLPKPLDDYGRMLFFLTNVSFLGGRRPLDCLRVGDVAAALQGAAAYGG